MAQDSEDKAKQRLEQVKNHISKTSPSSAVTAQPPLRRRRHKTTISSDSKLPADYSDITDQLDKLRSLASTPNPEHRGYAKQKASNKLWVRERVEKLLDPGSFAEVGSVSGDVVWRLKKEVDGSWDGRREEVVSFTPSNNVQGFGTVEGRKVVFTADDYSLRAGHADGAIWAKTIYLEKLSLSLRLPILKLVDGSSGGGSVTTIAKDGASYIPPLPALKTAVEQLNSGIPNLGAILGPAIGLGAARATMCHFSVMAADIGSLFNAGPKVVANATFEEGLSLQDLGGPDVHCRNGTIDNMARDEEDALSQLRRVLQYLPDAGNEIPPIVSCEDPASRKDGALRSIIPRRKERTYDPHVIIDSICDIGSFFEIGALWGVTVITGLARLQGHPVAVIGNNPLSPTGGALDAHGSLKIAKHLRFADIFNLPTIQLIDCPGYAIGTAAERAATMRHGVTAATTYLSTSAPIFSVIIRRCFGVAGGAMLDNRDPIMRIAWPSGVWGSLPLDGGIEAGHSKELRDAQKGSEEEGRRKYKELETMYLRLSNPVRTANRFGVEEIVDPATTRSVLCAWVTRMYESTLVERVAERRAGRLAVRYC